MTSEVLDSIRRHCAGISGFTLEQQRLFKEYADQDQRMKTIKAKGIDLMRERICKRMTLQNMRSIAEILIQSGADVMRNIVAYCSDIHLMLAAGLDERKLFDKGGDPAKCYSDTISGRQVNCLDISVKRCSGYASGCRSLFQALIAVRFASGMYFFH